MTSIIILSKISFSTHELIYHIWLMISVNRNSTSVVMSLLYQSSLWMIEIYQLWSNFGQWIFPVIRIDIKLHDVVDKIHSSGCMLLWIDFWGSSRPTHGLVEVLYSICDWMADGVLPKYSMVPVNHMTRRKKLFKTFFFLLYNMIYEINIRTVA